MTPDNKTNTDQRKEEIYCLEQKLRRESVRIVRAKEKKLSAEYIVIDETLKQKKADYEQIEGRPYTPPEPKPSQLDSRLFVRPRTRTASSELPSDTPEEKFEAKFS